MSALRQAINFAENPKHDGAAYTLKVRTKAGFEVKGVLVEFHSGAALIRVTERQIAQIGDHGIEYNPNEFRDVFVDESGVETVEVVW